MSGLVDRLAGVLGDRMYLTTSGHYTARYGETPASLAQALAEALGAVEEVEERHVGVQHERGVGCTCGHPGAGCYCPNSNWVGPPIPGTGRRETRTRTRVPDVVTDWEEA